MKYNPKLADKVNAMKTPNRDKPPATAPQVETEQKEYSFLGKEWGKQIHEAIQRKYKGIEAITKVIYDDSKDLVIGSNPFYVTAVNDELRSQGIRTATQADLERILKTNALPLENQYEDSSLVWHSNQDPNAYLATNLYEQAKQKGLTLRNGKPFVFPLYTLSLKEDTNSPHKLSFIIQNPELCFEAPILAEVSQQKFESSDIDEQTGLPKEVRQDGTRTLWTRTNGLLRLYLYGGLSANSGYEDLANSSGNGRVVIASEARAQKNKGVSK